MMEQYYKSTTQNTEAGDHEVWARLGLRFLSQLIFINEKHKLKL